MKLLTVLEKAPICAFDCEMTEQMQKVTLLQVGTLSGRAFVFDMRKLTDNQINCIAQVFKNNNVTKFGSGCAYDVVLLNRNFEFEITNFFDFIDLVSKILTPYDFDYYVGTKSGLKYLCNNLMAYEFYKLHWTDYEKFSLDVIPDNLIKYSALDVLTLIDLYLNLYFYTMQIRSRSKYEIMQKRSDIAGFAKRYFAPKKRSLSSIRSNFKY